MELTPRQKKIYIEKMYLDIELFAKIILDNHVTDAIPKHHKEMYGLLFDQSQRKKAIISPRGSAKSTVCSLIYPLWNIIFQRKKFIVIVSESYSQSVLFLDAIKQELEENEKIRYFFGNLVGGSKWSEGTIVTSTGIMVMAKGSGQKMRGLKFGAQRPQLIVLDDFESETNTGTPETRESLFRWVNGAVLPSLDPKGEIVLVGTIPHNDSYLENIRRIGNKSGWKVLYYQAIDEEAKTALWPERFPYEEIINLRNQYASQGLLDLWYMEYQNIAQDPKGRPFTDDMIQHYVGSVFMESDKWFIRLEDGTVEGVNLYCGVDPALGKVKGDWTVIMITAIDKNGKIYIVEYDRAKTKPVELIEKLFQTYMKYQKKITVVIETISYQESIIDFLRQRSMDEGVYIPVLEVKPRTGKSERLMSLQPYFAAKKVFIRREHVELIEELLTFPKGKHDDCMDAFWNTLQFKSKPSHTFAKVKSYVEDKVYDWMIGA